MKHGCFVFFDGILIYEIHIYTGSTVALFGLYMFIKASLIPAGQITKTNLTQYKKIYIH